MAGIRIALQVGFETTPPAALFNRFRSGCQASWRVTITRSHRWGRIGGFFAANADPDQPANCSGSAGFFRGEMGCQSWA